MKKIITLLILAISFSLANSKVAPKDKLIQELKEYIAKNKEDMKESKNPFALKDIKVLNNRIIYIYQVNLSKQKFKELKDKYNILRAYLVYKLKKLNKLSSKGKIKKDALYYLVKNYNYKVEYDYYLSSDPKKQVRFIIYSKEIISK